MSSFFSLIDLRRRLLCLVLFALAGSTQAQSYGKSTTSDGGPKIEAGNPRFQYRILGVWKPAKSTGVEICVLAGAAYTRDPERSLNMPGPFSINGSLQLTDNNPKAFPGATPFSSQNLQASELPMGRFVALAQPWCAIYPGGSPPSTLHVIEGGQSSMKLGQTAPDQTPTPPSPLSMKVVFGTKQPSNVDLRGLLSNWAKNQSSAVKGVESAPIRKD